MKAAELPADGFSPNPSDNHSPPAEAPAGTTGEEGNAPIRSDIGQPPTAGRVDDFGSKPGQASSDVALAPCRKCGVPNGWTASVCWGCEADLTAQGPLSFVEPAAPAATAPEEPGASLPAPTKPARSVPLAGPATDNAPAAPDVGFGGNIPVAAADAPPAGNVELDLPVLTSVVEDDARLLAFARAQRRPRRIPWAVASVLAIAVVAGVASLLVGRDAVFIALDKSPAAQVRATADAGPEISRVEAHAKAASAPIPPIDSGKPATVAFVEAPVSVTNAAQPAEVPPMRASQRNPQNVGQSRPQLAAPRPEAARPLPVPPGPCTSAVYALGLCSAGQSPTKN